MKAENFKVNTDSIKIIDNKIVLENVLFENQDLATYLQESDDKLASLINVIEMGVKTMNSLKNSIERDFTQNTFETISSEMKKNLSQSIEDIGDEFEKYFNEDGELIKELSENKERMINELNAELERFIDPNNRESATSKLTEILETEEGKVVEAFEKALNPDNKESQIHKLKENLEKKFTSEIKLLTDDIEKILQELKIDKVTAEIKEKSTAKGVTHEDSVQQALTEIAIGDVVERTGEIVGLITKSKVGDHVIDLNTGSKSSDLKIVFESKSANTYNSSSAITKELNKAMENRGADFGIFVFDSYERFDKISSLPFHILSENMALTVLNEETGDLPLKISYIWAKSILMNADEVTSKNLSISYDEIIKSLNEAVTQVKRLSKAKSNNKKAYDAVLDNETLIPEIRQNVQEKLNDLILLLDSDEDE
tara:strand:+ start:326 stop:1606 length:1281 start_codon:yes stop_codon:yes gene_type:complete